MGYRMRIWPEGYPQKVVGDDHKLYAYTDLINVIDSFDFLVHNDLSKDGLFKEYLNDGFGLDVIYDVFSSISYSDKIILNENAFKKFAVLYLDNYKRTYPNSNHWTYVANYLSEMANMKCNKILQWV